MAAKELVSFGLENIGSGMAETVHGNAGKGFGKMLGGGLGLALGLTVGVVQLGAKAIKAAKKAAEEDQQ